MAVQYTKTLTEAAKIAGTLCTQWKFQDDTDDMYDLKSLTGMAKCGDDDYFLDEDDEDEYYIVTEEGAIGETDDGGESINWLYLPLNLNMDAMPESMERED